MNNTNVVDYIRFAYWALKSKQSIHDCFKLDDSAEAIVEHVNKIINDTELTQELCNILPILNQTKPSKKKKEPVNNAHILQNMEAYDTTQEEAHKYESHCHNCGNEICIGHKYCGKGCFKFVEDFNFDCFWGESCKMCRIHREYIVVTRKFEITGKTYWIDDEKNVYNDQNEKVAMEREGNIIYTN